jgi:hypothetical protein
MTNFREEFYESWIEEMPQRTTVGNLWSVLQNNIKDFVDNGVKVVDVKQGLRKIDLNSTAIYWYYDQNNIPIVIVELNKKSQNYTVGAVGKKTQGQPPWTTDLYLDIIDDCKKNGLNNIRLSSDNLISDAGFSIWKKLLTTGHKVWYYDNTIPGQTLHLIKDSNELNSLFGPNNDLSKYQFVISESKDKFLEIYGQFLLRRTLELTGRLDRDDNR